MTSDPVFDRWNSWEPAVGEQVTYCGSRSGLTPVTATITEIQYENGAPWFGLRLESGRELFTFKRRISPIGDDDVLQVLRELEEDLGIAELPDSSSSQVGRVRTGPVVTEKVKDRVSWGLLWLCIGFFLLAVVFNATAQLWLTVIFTVASASALGSCWLFERWRSWRARQ